MIKLKYFFYLLTFKVMVSEINRVQMFSCEHKLRDVALTMRLCFQSKRKI